MAHHRLGLEAQNILNGANGLGEAALLGIESGQKQAGFPVFRVQGQDMFILLDGLLQLVEAHVQAGQQEIGLLLLGVQL